MSNLINHLTKTDHRIGELNQRVDLYHNRVARKANNPALAEQAQQLLPAMRAELAELTRYRKRLVRALEVQASLSPAAEPPRRGPVIPPTCVSRPMGPFQQPRVLVVEDEPLIGLDVVGLLKDAGCEVVGPFNTVAAAVRSIDHHHPDAAVLDFNLGGETSVPIADTLAKSGVPFVWLTGYSKDILPERHRERPFVMKPFSPETLLGSLAASLVRRMEPAKAVPQDSPTARLRS